MFILQYTMYIFDHLIVFFHCYFMLLYYVVFWAGGLCYKNKLYLLTLNKSFKLFISVVFVRIALLCKPVRKEIVKLFCQWITHKLCSRYHFRWWSTDHTFFWKTAVLLVVFQMYCLNTRLLNMAYDYYLKDEL
jgi:hypothetical protein